MAKLVRSFNIPHSIFPCCSHRIFSALVWLRQGVVAHDAGRSIIGNRAMCPYVREEDVNVLGRFNVASLPAMWKTGFVVIHARAALNVFEGRQEYATVLMAAARAAMIALFRCSECMSWKCLCSLPPDPLLKTSCLFVLREVVCVEGRQLEDKATKCSTADTLSQSADARTQPVPAVTPTALCQLYVRIAISAVYWQIPHICTPKTPCYCEKSRSR